jgi:hypothetical protein
MIFFGEFFISALKDEICAHIIMARPQTWVEDNKRAKESQHVVSSQNINPSFIPHLKLFNLAPSSTPLKIHKLTWAEMVERQLKEMLQL